MNPRGLMNKTYLVIRGNPNSTDSFQRQSKAFFGKQVDRQFSIFISGHYTEMHDVLMIGLIEDKFDFHLDDEDESVRAARQVERRIHNQ